MSDLKQPPDDEVKRLFVVLLDNLLFPEAKKAQLIDTLSIDKKWAMIKENIKSGGMNLTSGNLKLKAMCKY